MQLFKRKPRCHGNLSKQVILAPSSLNHAVTNLAFHMPTEAFISCHTVCTQRSRVTLQPSLCRCKENMWSIFLLPYRYDLSTDSNGFMSSVAEIISIDGDGLSLPFVGPACIISTQQKWIYTLRGWIRRQLNASARNNKEMIGLCNIISDTLWKALKLCCVFVTWKPSLLWADPLHRQQHRASHCQGSQAPVETTQQFHMV